MLAFSGCGYGGGDKERNELGEISKKWATLPVTSPDGDPKRGKCPLTPHEVGLIIQALCFENNTYLWRTMSKRGKCPLEPFLPYSSQLAAIDYIVCDESDVFVTNNNGNIAKILAGRRRYVGRKRTIRPNANKLNALFFKSHKIPWEIFAKEVKAA